MHKILITLSVIILFAVGFAACGYAVDAADAEELYERCASCHGADGSTPAMGGASPVLKGQTAEELEEKLLGYQNETYGGDRAKLMITQVRSLSPEEVKALAEYIAAF